MLLFTLLLQVATVAQALSANQGTPPAVWATLIAAILALLSSLNSARVARKTTREVTELSTKTSREVAALSAQTARESAQIASQTAKEIKKEDFKHDFYKKLIQRRLDAWTEAESLLPLLYGQITIGDDKSVLFDYFENGVLFDTVLDKINSCMVLSVWLGRDYAYYIQNFHQTLHAIRVKCQMSNKQLENQYPAINDNLLRQAGKEQYKECNKLLYGYARILGQQISTLHDIDAFFEQLALLGGNA